MTAYYNEIDPAAAQWLRNLIDAGLIAPGDVDTRSIEDITPNELRGYTQCHFFAGIGGWSLALRLAGWPDSRRVWTGSCPCQPFSAAGKGAGFDDQRHLWPAWFHLIKECRPDSIFGEQVAAAAGFGWLDLVSSDLEGQGYRCGAAVLGAHSVGAPHIRQRLWFVADADHQRCDWQRLLLRAEKEGWQPCGVSETSGRGGAGELGNANDPRLERRQADAKRARKQPARPAGLANSWADAERIPCADRKTRLIESGLEPLAHGIPARVVRLRAYGNAIVPQVAAEFIAAYCDVAGLALGEMEAAA